MKLRQKRITSTIALLLVFSITQIYVGLSFAGSTPNTVAAPSFWQDLTGSLTTQGNKAVSLNGATANSGSTVVSGASIETPAGVGGSVNLATLGSLNFDGNTKLTLEFQKGSVKVMVLQGCVTLYTKKGTAGEIDTSTGVAGKTDAANGGTVKTCAPGSVATAGAAGGGGGGMGTAETISLLVLAGTIAATPFINRGGNPSPSAP